jgi:hypothetical protein
VEATLQSPRGVQPVALRKMSTELQATEPVPESVRAWFDPADAARYGGWSYRTIWRKAESGLPVYYGTDGTPSVYRHDIDAFKLGASAEEMPSRLLRLKLQRRSLPRLDPTRGPGCPGVSEKPGRPPNPPAAFYPIRSTAIG